MKIVYVLGCLGFIGSYITEKCLKNGWYVIGVDSVTYAANLELLVEFNKNEKFKFIKSDINDLDHLYDCDYIINCAAETHVDNSIASSKQFIHSNINGVYNILELMKNRPKFNMPVLLHFSTDEVYGDIVEGSHTESDILKPSNPYSASKASADMLIQAWNRTYDIPYIIVRPTNNYGKRQHPEKLIPKACKCLNLHKKIPLHDYGKPIRTWLHVEDTVNAIMRIIDYGKINNIYNISGNYQDSNFFVVSKILAFYFSHNVDIKDYIDNFSRVGQDVRYSLDDSKLQNIGWKPSAKFDDKLKEIVKYYKKTFIW